MPDTATLRSARPTIQLDGADAPSLSEGLLRMVIAEQTDGLYRCEAHFGNWGPRDGATDFLYFDRAALEFGKSIRIALGTDVLFEGRITALEAHFPAGSPPELAVLADDRFQDLRMTRRTRSFANMTDAAVVEQIARDHGLSASHDLPSITHKVLAQVNQSDLAFLRDRMRAVGAELWLAGTTLHAKRRPARTAATAQLGYRRELHSFVVTADLAHQRTAVVTSGWDVAGKQALRYEATDTAIASELGADTSGARILRDKLGARKDALVHTVPYSITEAQARAEAHYRLIARRFVTGQGVAETSSQLRVGNLVELTGLGPLFSGRYVLTRVAHLFDTTDGLRSEIATERAGLGQPS